MKPTQLLKKLMGNNMKKTKIFMGNQYITKFNCNGEYLTFMQKVSFYFRRCLKTAGITMLIAWALVGSLKFGEYNLSKTTIVKAEVEVKVMPKFEEIPMLVKICKAESGGRQFNKNGDVLRGNVDKSDIGFCQINERYNNDLARKLGYDIYTEQGNKDFAVYLFYNRGTEPWNASKANWNK